MRINKKDAAHKANLITFKNHLLALVIIIFIGSPLWAQIKINAADPGLAFGSFATGSTGGTVVVSPEGNRSVSGTIIKLANSPVSAAVFEITVNGKAKGNILFNFPKSAQLTQLGGTGSMAITEFTSDVPGSIWDTTGGPPRNYTVNVGATLIVQNSMVNPPGDYIGTFTVTFINQ